MPSIVMIFAAGDGGGIERSRVFMSPAKSLPRVMFSRQIVYVKEQYLIYHTYKIQRGNIRGPSFNFK